MYNVRMESLRFEWDSRKARSNLEKHGVSFDEAQSAFYDEYAAVYPDPDHSEEEDRFLLLGMSTKARALVVCHCFRSGETRIRIISARKATKNESREYWKMRP